MSGDTGDGARAFVAGSGGRGGCGGVMICCDSGVFMGGLVNVVSVKVPFQLKSYCVCAREGLVKMTL
jgi:hypothetical protein